MYQPLARKDGLTVRELPEETLVYDLARNKAHCLNRTLALVWRHCDGRHGVAALARVVEKQLGIADGEAVVGLALEQLGRRQLLAEAPAALTGPARQTRREALRRLALVAVALPVAMTITTRRIAASFKYEGQKCHPTKDQCTGCGDGKEAVCEGGVCRCKEKDDNGPTPPSCAKAGQPCTPGSTDNGGCGSGCTCSGGALGSINSGTCT